MDDGGGGEAMAGASVVGATAGAVAGAVADAAGAVGAAGGGGGGAAAVATAAAVVDTVVEAVVEAVVDAGGGVDAAATTAATSAATSAATTAALAGGAPPVATTALQAAAAAAASMPDASPAQLLYRWAAPQAGTLLLTLVCVAVVAALCYYAFFKVYYLTRDVHVSPVARKAFIGDTLRVVVRAPKRLPRESVSLRVIGRDGRPAPPPPPPAPASASATPAATATATATPGHPTEFDRTAPPGDGEFQCEFGPVHLPGQ